MNNGGKIKKRKVATDEANGEVEESNSRRSHLSKALAHYGYGGRVVTFSKTSEKLPMLVGQYSTSSSWASENESYRSPVSSDFFHVSREFTGE